jgi:hypothetical protein
MESAARTGTDVRPRRVALLAALAVLLGAGAVRAQEPDSEPMPAAEPPEAVGNLGLGLAVRVGQSLVGDTTKQTASGAQLGMLVENYASWGRSREGGLGPSLRILFDSHVGGSNLGFEGSLQGAVAYGGRWSFGSHHGPVWRSGARVLAETSGVGDTLVVNLPQAELGYQYLKLPWLLELRAEIGAVLYGRYDVSGVDTRKLDNTVSLGGSAVIWWNLVSLSTSYATIPGHDRGQNRAVNMVEARLCSRAGPARAGPALDLCGYYRRYSGTVLSDLGDADSSMSFAGFSVGMATRLDPAP